MRTFLIILLLSGAAYAQGGLFNDVALNSAGRPAPGATVRVCTSSATGTPCSPAVTVYSEVTLTSVQSTTTADANGNFNFYVTPGFYKVQVTYLGSTYTYTVAVPDPLLGRATTGYNEFGTSGTAYDSYQNCTRTWSQTSAPPDNNYCARDYIDIETGGVNSTGSKSQFGGHESTVVKRSVGQASGSHVTVGGYGDGDNNGFSAEVTVYGGSPDGGGEGGELGRGDLSQGTVEFTGTITGVSTDTLTYGSASNENTRGQNRIIVNTNAAKIYSTGTVTGIAGTLPVVTGSGTLWLSLGSGAVSNYFFELTGCNNGALKYIVPVKSFDSNTTLTLNNTALNANQPWACSTVSGNYKIYKGSHIATIGASGSVTVTAGEGVNFAAADTFAVPISFNNYLEALYMGQLTYSLPPIYAGALLQLQVAGSYPLERGGYFAGAGTLKKGFEIAPSGGVTNDLFTSPVSVGGSLLASSYIGSSTQQVLKVLNGSSVQRLLTYDRTNDWWQWSGGQYMSGSDARVGVGTNPQANIADYLYYNNASWGGFHISPNVLPSSNSSALAPFKVQVAGVPEFAVEKDRVIVNNGLDFKMFSDNETTMKFSVVGASGNVSTPGSITSTLATGSAPLVITSTTPVANLTSAPLIYNHSGTQVTGGHEVLDVCTLGTDCSVTLTGSAVYTSSSSYSCAPVDKTAAAAVRFNPSSGSAFAFTGTGTDVIAYRCTGN